MMSVRLGCFLALVCLISAVIAENQTVESSLDETNDGDQIDETVSSKKKKRKKSETKNKTPFKTPYQSLKEAQLVWEWHEAMRARNEFLIEAGKAVQGSEGLQWCWEGSEEFIPQIPKCCPEGESLEFQKGCTKSNLTFEPKFLTTDTSPAPKKVDLLIGDRCNYGRYRLEPSKDSVDEFHLLPSGYLLVPFLDENQLSPLDYCLDSFVDENGSTVVLPLVCFPPPPPNNPWKDIALIVYPIGCLISVPFLIATVIIYLTITELRNVQGKVLSCYSICLAIAYFCLACVQIWGEKLEQRFCIVIAFMIQFFFVACFFWLNVMCFHTWRRMKKGNVLKYKKNQNKNKLFICYSLYGWGFPLLILFISLVMDLMPTIPSSYLKPNFGTEACWFQNDEATLSYFYGPISVLLALNVIFFVLTMMHLHLNAEKRMNHFHDVAVQIIINRRRKMFVQCLLLFCVMGLTWILEVLSWSVGKPPQLWLVVDTFNTLQGIIVFIVFVVCDPKVRTLVSEKCKIFKRKEIIGDCSLPLNTTDVP